MVRYIVKYVNTGLVRPCFGVFLFQVHHLAEVIISRR